MAAEVDSSKEAVSKQLRVLDSTSASARERVRAMDTLAAIGKARTSPLADPIPLLNCLRWLLTSKNMFTRCSALRIIRSYAHDRNFILRAWEAKLDWLIARSMDRSSDRDKKLEKERNEAYRLVQRCVELLMKDHKAERALLEGGLAAPSSPSASKERGGAERVGSSMPRSLSCSMLSNSPHSVGQGSSQDSNPGVLSMSNSFEPPLTPRGASTGGQAPPAAQGASAPYPLLPRGLVFRIASTVENSDDTFQKRAVALLRDLLIAAPQCVADANAMRSIVHVLTDPELTPLHRSVVIALLHALDHPASRKHIRLGLDLQPIFAPFTEKIGKELGDLKKRLQCSKQVLLIFLQTWPGLLYLSYDSLGLKPLVDTLRLPGPAFRKIVIFELLHVAIQSIAPHRGIPVTGPWTDYTDELRSAPGGRRDGDDGNTRLDRVHRSAGVNSSHPAGSSSPEGAGRSVSLTACAGHSVLDVFLGAVLLVLEKTGLTTTLVSLVKIGMSDSSASTVIPPSTAAVQPQKQTTNSSASAATPVIDAEKLTERQRVLVSQSAAHLLQTVLMLSSSLFPGASSYKLYGDFDRTIVDRLAKSWKNGRQAAMHAAAKVRGLSNAVFHEITYSVPSAREVRLDSIKLQMSSNMEDAQFRILLNDSQVTATKDWNKWNAETALFLIKGPLRLHSRLQEAMKTKFFKRLLTFLKPSRRLFSELPYKEENLIYSDLACGLVDLLLQTREGMRYLAASGLFEEFFSILKEVTENSAERDKVLCKERIMYFMAREYFRIIGKCSENVLGVELLVSKGVLGLLQSLMSQLSRQRDDICHQILKHLHFGRVGSQPFNAEAKAIFECAMSEGSRPIRLCATLKLKRLSYMQGYRDMVDWTLDILEGQLTDSWREVAKAAHDIINEWCMVDDEVLDMFIMKKPSLTMFTSRDEKEQAEDPSHCLLLRMLTREAGFCYLNTLGVVKRQLRAWTPRLSIAWAANMERNLAQNLFSAADSGGAQAGGGPITASRRQSGRRLDSTAQAAAAAAPAALGGSGAEAADPSAFFFPPHFFGEMAKTVQGTECLLESGCLSHYAMTIKASVVSDTEMWEGAESKLGPLDSLIHRCEDSEGDEAEVEEEEEEEDSEEDDEELILDENDHTMTAHPHMSYDFTTRPWLLPSKERDAEALSKVKGPDEFDDSEYLLPQTKTKDKEKGMAVKNSLELRAALWVIAQVASSDTGFATLEIAPHCSGVLRLMIRMATYAECLSLRGTLFCMLSLIGQSQKGRDMLSQYGWVTNKSEGYSASNGAWVGVCVAYPGKYHEWATIRQSEAYQSPSTAVHPAEPGLVAQKVAAETLFADHGITTKNAPDFYPMIDSIATELALRKEKDKQAIKRDYCVLLALSHREMGIHNAQQNAFDVVMGHVRTMANPVMVDGARKSLAKVRQDISIFHDPHLALEMHDLLNTYRFRTATRKYLYDTYVEQATHTHEAFAYLDARYSPMRREVKAPAAASASAAPGTADTSLAAPHLETVSTVGDGLSSGRSSPTMKPTSPSLSRLVPSDAVNPGVLSDASNSEPDR